MMEDINGIVFCLFIFILLFIIGMYLRTGRGAMLLNFYNIMSKERKANYNEKALCHFFGNIILLIDCILIFAMIAGIFEVTSIILALFLVIAVISIVSTIYAYTNERFRK